MHLIVGLGNPDNKYLSTRHNIGFTCIDAMAQRYESINYRSEHKAHTKKIVFKNYSCLLVKPQTYMNLSGEAVAALMQYYKITQDKLLVIHDDIDLDFQEIRFQMSRGHGGNNGIRSIHEKLASKDYGRLKIGVGRPNGKTEVSSHVLQSFNDEEFKVLPEMLNNTLDAIEFYIEHGLEMTANKFNQRKKS